MSVVSRTVRASPEQVWAVLADGWLYPSWVVGASRMRGVDAGWPAPGSKLHHSVGSWPLLLNDNTEVVEAEPPAHLVLQARGWPFGEARVDLRLAPDGAGLTRVRMEEQPTHGSARLGRIPPAQALVSWRNVESLRRLAMIAEGHARPVERAG